MNELLIGIVQDCLKDRRQSAIESQLDEAYIEGCEDLAAYIIATLTGESVTDIKSTLNGE